jgi:hypothetical protein
MIRKEDTVSDPAIVTWHGRTAAPEPPPHIRHVRDDHDGLIADRTDEPCDHCCGDGSIWRWRHNGNADCWLEIDGIGPWAGWE